MGNGGVRTALEKGNLYHYEIPVNEKGGKNLS